MPGFIRKGAPKPEAPKSPWLPVNTLLPLLRTKRENPACCTAIHYPQLLPRSCSPWHLHQGMFYCSPCAGDGFWQAQRVAQECPFFSGEDKMRLAAQLPPRKRYCLDPVSPSPCAPAPSMFSSASPTHFHGEKASASAPSQATASSSPRLQLTLDEAEHPPSSRRHSQSKLFRRRGEKKIKK